MKKILALLSISSILLWGCNANNNSKNTISASAKEPSAIDQKDSTAAKPANAQSILAKKEVPILCYHQIRDWQPSDGQRAHDDIISPVKFNEHVKMLADSGYTSILPDQLYDYLVYNKPLPPKPIMFTFDDTDLDQYIVAAPTLKKYGFKAVYFIMTVSIGKKGRIAYMNKAQIKELADAGNTIASHTYDHKNFAKFTDADWETQIAKPNKTIEEITGKKVEYFAYPYGVYKAENLAKLKEYGFKLAFILSTKQDQNEPLLTVRRIIDPGTYTAKNLYNSINKSFNKAK